MTGSVTLVLDDSVPSSSPAATGGGPTRKLPAAGMTVEAIAQIALQSSKRERGSVEAEREYFDVLKVRLMRSHVGEDFDGIISSVTSFGFFVQLKEHFVEGLVRLSNIKEDFFVYDEVRMSLRGRRTGLTFHMGQLVRVKLAAANLLKRQLDLEWLPPAKKQRAN